MSEDNKQPMVETDPYRGLTRLLHGVRWTQHLLAIIAEVLILLSFAMSGMDVSLGGVMASIPLLKVLWAAMFALGIDTAFALSWVRVRQCIMRRKWLALAWNMLLALGMSLIIFQPLVIQLYQQAVSASFNQALDQLGINIVVLTYARSAVAVFLGAILAMTNVESDVTAQQETTGPRRKFILLDRVINRIAPVVSTDNAETEQVKVTEEQPAQLEAPTKQEDLSVSTTPEQRQQAVKKLKLGNLDNQGKVIKVLELFPNVSDRELGKLSGVSAVTAKKYRELYNNQTKVESEV